MERYGKSELATLLPVPAPEANKYTRGKLILFAGSAKYPGAAILAACAGQRAGAGYTEVLTAPSAVTAVQSHQASLVVRSWKNFNVTALAESTKVKPCAYVLGSGFDITKEATNILSYLLLGKAKAPVLVDGGAFQAIGTEAGQALCKHRLAKGLPTVITPHGGEAARLAAVFDLPSDDPIELCYALAASYGVVTVLKGPDTFISNGEEVFSITNGPSALAKAGTGDVLAGIIGAFLAQGLSALDAAVLGTSLHAKAGLLAAEELSSLSVTPEDVINYLPLAIKDLLEFRLG